MNTSDFNVQIFICLSTDESAHFIRCVLVAFLSSLICESFSNSLYLLFLLWFGLEICRNPFISWVLALPLHLPFSAFQSLSPHCCCDFNLACSGSGSTLCSSLSKCLCRKLCSHYHSDLCSEWGKKRVHKPRTCLFIMPLIFEGCS